MESFGGFRFSDINRTMRKKRSNRRPRNGIRLDYAGNSSLSSSPPSDDGSKVSSDENTGRGTSYRRKELNLSQCNSRASYTNLADAEKSMKISVENEARMKEDFELQSRSRDTQISRRTSGGHSSGRSEIASDGKGNDNIVKKVKLKVGGVVRTIHAKPVSDAAASVCRSPVMKSPQKLIAPENSDEDHSSSLDKGSGLRGIPWKDFSGSGFHVGKESLSIKKYEKHEPVRKSKRVPKRRLLDGTFGDEEEDDDEIRYLAKLKTSKTAAGCGAKYDDEDDIKSKKQQKISRVLSRNIGGNCNLDVGSYGSSRPGKESKNSKLGRESEDTDYVEDEEQVSDGELEIESKKQRKERVDVFRDSKMAVTTRQRALQSGKDISSGSGAGLVEFPYGLPPAPPRKQKDKLSDVEQQLKKAEAAQRRRMQNEKAARESEAEAIRKILGQDSSRKKREDKIKQRQDELGQERTAKAVTLSSNTVRWVIGPTGTVVTFPDDMGLPNIFEPKPCSYPPPREKCAGPSCSNPYKYRDSRSKLPLCSLRCYKAVQEKMQPMTFCI